MRKRLIVMLLALGITMAVPAFAAQADEEPELRQYEDLYWYVEDDYAVIGGNIYDRTDTSASSAGVTKMVIPSEIEGYPVKVFDGHFMLLSPKVVILPEGLATIRKDAFHNASIEYLSIPSTVTLIEPGAIRWCSGLKRIDVAADNPNYKSIDGMLYTKDGKELLYCPTNIDCSGDTFFIPEGTEKIQSHAFSSFNYFGALPKIKTLVFPEGLTTMDDWAMYDSAFEAVYFPSTLEYMGNHSFGVVCPDVYFAGSSFPACGKDLFSDATRDVSLHFDTLFPAEKDPIPTPTPTPKPTPSPQVSAIPASQPPAPTLSAPPATKAPEQQPEPPETAQAIQTYIPLLALAALVLGLVFLLPRFRKPPKKGR